MQLGRPVQREFNNLQMTTAEFIVLNDQRALRGIAAFVSHRGRTYQMIGYADRTRYGRFAQELMNIVQSFAPVSDPEILSVEPQRIDVVRVDRSQTLAQFAERYRSAVPVERLAVINQLPGGTSRIEAGTLIKRVVS